jgi:hypothetical protein
MSYKGARVSAPIDPPPPSSLTGPFGYPAACPDCNNAINSCLGPSLSLTEMTKNRCRKWPRSRGLGAEEKTWAVAHLWTSSDRLPLCRNQK